MSSTTWTQEAGMTGDIDSDNVQDLVDQAEDSKDAAAASETAAATSATSAATSATNAANSAASSASSASDASTSETNAATSATSAASSATSSASSASAASTSESNAAASASAAAASESAAGTSETNAATSATNAASSASDASGSAGDASTSADAAAASASAAAASESAAASSETAAGTSETNAANSATSASTSATNAANSETNAATSATNAATSETNAATSASNASTSATAASNAQTAAEAAQAAAEAAQEAIDGTYLGALASDPTVDGNGDAVTTGDWYYNTTDSQAYIYNGSSWDALAPDLVGDTTPQLGGNLDTNGNDIKFGDNDEATFGASDDFRVYHDSTSGHTYLKETGGGSTVLQTNTFVVQNAAGTQNIIHAPEGTSGVDISYNGSTKLSTTPTGIDVTGVITTDGLTTSADINFGDNDKAIFGAGSDLQIYHDGSNSYITDAGTGDLILTSSTAHRVRTDQFQINNAANTEQMISAVANGAVTIRYDGAAKLATTSTGVDVTGTVTADGLTVGGDAELNDNSPTLTFWDANGVDQNFRLAINGGTANIQSTLDDGTNTTRQRWSTNGDISFYEDTGTTAKFFWDASAESLGIGTSDPLDKLHIAHTDSVTYSASTIPSGLRISRKNSDNTVGEAVGIEFDVTGWSGTYTGVAGISAIQTAGNSSADLAFQTRDGGTYAERMRIDSSGNVLVGKTAVGSDDGVQLRPNSASKITQDSQNVLILDRHTSDGDILEFRKDETTVGSIGTASSYLTIGSGVTGLLFDDVSAKSIRPWNLSTNSSSDADTDLGLSSQRFKNLYLSGGVYLGGTGSANYLDDYEEGSWTPTAVQGCTGLNVVATGYTKVGRLVTVNFYLNNFTGTDANRLTLGGLPFAVKSSTYYTALVEVNDSPYAGARIGGSSTTQITFFDVSSSTRTSYPGTNVTSHLIGSITYETN